MIKTTILFCLFIFASYGQDARLSSASEFINHSTYVQINLDENEKAVFKSGLGETVEFYPAEIIDLKKETKSLGLAVESTFITGQVGMKTTSVKETAWIGIEEVDDLIIWFDTYIVPNLDASAGKKKTVKYVFNCKEVMLKFEIYNNTQIFSVILNNSFFKDKYFWTESKVRDIPNVINILKKLKSKKA